MVVPADPRTTRRAQPVKFWPRSNTVSPDGACRIALGRSSRTRRTGGGAGGGRGGGAGGGKAPASPAGVLDGGVGPPGSLPPAAGGFSPRVYRAGDRAAR